jgi:hypothetical protein
MNTPVYAHSLRCGKGRASKAIPASTFQIARMLMKYKGYLRVSHAINRLWLAYQLRDST